MPGFFMFKGGDRDRMKQEEFNKLLAKSRFPKECEIILRAIKKRLNLLEARTAELEKGKRK